jgi:hypothetical protein
MAPDERILGLAGYAGLASVLLSASVHPYHEPTKGGTLMTTQPVVAQHRIWVWVLRIGFFAFGAFFLLQSILSNYFGPNGPIQAVLLIILSFLVSAATRHRILGWLLLTLTAVCAVLPLVGVSIIYGLAGGNQATPPWGAIGFWMVFLGIFGFYPSAIATVVAALPVYVMEWRDRHGRAATPPPSGTH